MRLPGVPPPPSGLGGRGMSAAQMFQLARQAQEAQLAGDTERAQAISYRIRGAPGAVFADIDAAGKVRAALEAGDMEAAWEAYSRMSGQSIRAKVEALLEQATGASRRTLPVIGGVVGFGPIIGGVVLVIGGVVGFGLLGLYWWRKRPAHSAQ